MVKVVLQCVSMNGAPKKPSMGKVIFLPAVKVKVARIDRESRAVINECLDF